MVCDRLKVAPDRCLYVGDGGSKELTGAAESGMDVVLIRASYDTVNGDREEWQGTRISELKQVLDLV
jgi:putative hydrolase of the HAD superfamily